MIQFDGEFGLGSVKSKAKSELLNYHQKEDERLLSRVEITLNVGLNPRSSIMSAPNEVIWKHALYLRVFDSKCRDSGVSPRSNECNGSGGGGNNGNFTLPLGQHNPGVSPANFNAPQWLHTISIGPIRTKGCEL
jgi:hypothetical protein